jgi:hypothetical protein
VTEKHLKSGIGNGVLAERVKQGLRKLIANKKMGHVGDGETMTSGRASASTSTRECRTVALVLAQRGLRYIEDCPHALSQPACRAILGGQAESHQ